MTDDEKNLIDELFASDAASALTNRAARALEGAIRDRDRYKMACDADGKVVVDLAGSMRSMTPEMIEAMAPILLNPTVMMLEKQVQDLQEALDRVRVAIGMAPGIAGKPGDIATEAEKRFAKKRED